MTKKKQYIIRKEFENLFEVQKGMLNTYALMESNTINNTKGIVQAYKIVKDTKDQYIVEKFDLVDALDDIADQQETSFACCNGKNNIQLEQNIAHKLTDPANNVIGIDQGICNSTYCFLYENELRMDNFTALNANYQKR
ncbi:hypothetical protein K9M74_04360 [Candidatus Woesearchaeota archaeon]|nr:hypothetical protein [Candidatus Woesearchaeota archaeon]